MNEPTYQDKVNGKTVNCNPSLKGFKIFKKDSSNVDYFGTYHSVQESQLFMQFLTGKCYVYSNVPKEVLDLAETSESIGKFFYKFIKGKYPEQEVQSFCVQDPGRHIGADDDDWDADEDIDGGLGLDDRELGGSPFGGIGGDDWSD